MPVQELEYARISLFEDTRCVRSNEELLRLSIFWLQSRVIRFTLSMKVISNVNCVMEVSEHLKASTLRRSRQSFMKPQERLSHEDYFEKGGMQGKKPKSMRNFRGVQTIV